MDLDKYKKAGTATAPQAQAQSAPPRALVPAGAAGAILSGMKDAKVFDRGVYFDPGSYVVEITKMLIKKTERSGMAFIVETKVLESSRPDCKPGDPRTWLRTLQDSTMAFGQIKGFMLALINPSPEDKAIVEENIEAITVDGVEGDGVSMAGRKIRVLARSHTTKGTTTAPPKVITVCDFKPYVAEQTGA